MCGIDVVVLEGPCAAGLAAGKGKGSVIFFVLKVVVVSSESLVIEVVVGV